MCLCVFAGKRGPCSDILHLDCGRTTKRGRPRIGEIVQKNCRWLLILHAFIWECAKCNINNMHPIRPRFRDQISRTNCGPPNEVRKVHDSPYSVRHTSPRSPVICVYFSRSTIYTTYRYVCVCVYICLYCLCVVLLPIVDLKGALKFNHWNISNQV